MIGMYASAIALVVAGAAIGILVMVCLGIKRDDRPGGFPAGAHDRTARAARKMTGAGTRSPELAPRPAAGRTSCRFSEAAALARHPVVRMRQADPEANPHTPPAAGSHGDGRDGTSSRGNARGGFGKPGIAGRKQSGDLMLQLAIPEKLASLR